MSNTHDDMFDFAAGRASPRVESRLAKQQQEPGSELYQLLQAPPPPTVEASDDFGDAVQLADSEQDIQSLERQRSGKRRELLRALKRPKAWLGTAILVGACAGIAWAGVALFAEKPLLKDNFNDRWLNPVLWFTPRPIVREENGHLTLVNRGYLVTDAEFRDPISLSLRWRWRDFGWPAYSDNLSIVLRTSGQPKPRHNFLITDGIAITFDAGDGSIGIYLMPDGTKLARTDAGTLPMPAGEWHDIRITDDGETIAVYLHGPEIPKKRDEKPILTARRPERSQAYHIAVYNRELVAQVPHESHIDDFVVERLR